VIDEVDAERVANAGKGLAPAASAYIEEDFIMNLLETVLDYMLQTTVVVKALEYFRANRWSEVRTLDDLDAALSSYPDDQQGNTRLARYFWGYNLWTRAQQLRGLTRYFRSIGVVDQETLKAWAHRSDFRTDFEGRVKGLGPAVYQWLVMRQGVLEGIAAAAHAREHARGLDRLAEGEARVLPRFRRSSQRWFVDLIVNAHPAPPRGSSSRVSCGAGC
jgi:hypothetical protein